jgi:hypothetical protein
VQQNQRLEIWKANKQNKAGFYVLTFFSVNYKALVLKGDREKAMYAEPERTGGKQ